MMIDLRGYAIYKKKVNHGLTVFLAFILIGLAFLAVLVPFWLSKSGRYISFDISTSTPIQNCVIIAGIVLLGKAVKEVLVLLAAFFDRKFSGRHVKLAWFKKSMLPVVLEQRFMMPRECAWKLMLPLGMTIAVFGLVFFAFPMVELLVAMLLFLCLEIKNALVILNLLGEEPDDLVMLHEDFYGYFLYRKKESL